MTVSTIYISGCSCSYFFPYISNIMNNTLKKTQTLHLFIKFINVQAVQQVALGDVLIKITVKQF